MNVSMKLGAEAAAQPHRSPLPILQRAEEVLK